MSPIKLEWYPLDFEQTNYGGTEADWTPKSEDRGAGHGDWAGVSGSDKVGLINFATDA